MRKWISMTSSDSPNNSQLMLLTSLVPYLPTNALARLRVDLTVQVLALQLIVITPSPLTLQLPNASSIFTASLRNVLPSKSSDKSPGYDGTIDDATDYFTQSFGPQLCDTAHLLEELSSFIPSADTDTLCSPHPLPKKSPPNYDQCQTLPLAKTASNTTICVSSTQMQNPC
jgi:hypothetical protein